jgi:hypothetical protein
LTVLAFEVSWGHVRWVVRPGGPTGIAPGARQKHSPKS